MPEKVAEILKIYASCGKEAYLVGGSVRDSLLSLPLHDIDIATSATPEETKNIFKDFKIVDTGIDFGTLTLFYKDEKIEITTFRKDENYCDGRHPSQVSFASDLKQDLERRDFTINAMAASENGEIIDFFDGISDLKNKKIKAVGNPFLRFSEDKLRIIRALRFSLSLGFKIEENTLNAARSFLPQINEVSRERIGSETAKILPFLNEKNGVFYKDFFEQCFPSCIFDEECFKAVSHFNSNLEFMLAALFISSEKSIVFKTVCDFAFSKKVAENVSFLVEFCKKSLKNEQNSIDFVLTYGKEKYIKLYNFKKTSGDEIFNLFPVFQSRPFSLKELSVNGNDLLDLGIKPEKIGAVLTFFLHEAAHGNVQNNKQDLLTLITI